MPRTYPLPAAWVQVASGSNPVGSGGSASVVQSTLGLQVHSQVHMILADADVVYREFHGSTPGYLGPNLHPNLHDTCIHTPPKCQDRFSSTILLGGPGMQGTNEEVSPDTSRC